MRYEYDNKTTAFLLNKKAAFESMRVKSAEALTRYDIILNTLKKRGDL